MNLGHEPMKRRDFLRTGIGGVLGLSGTIALPAKAQQAVQRPKILSTIRHRTPSILQGPTDDQSTQITILYKRSVNLKVHAVSADGLVIEPALLEASALDDGQTQQVTQVGFTGLAQSAPYRLQVFDASTGESLDERNFSTLRSDQENLKFAVISCLDPKLHEPAIWKDLLAQKPDAVFLIGDSCYADRGSGSDGAEPERLWNSFVEARQILQIYFETNLVPFFSIWDDHDFGINNGDSEYPNVARSQENFLRFFPNSSQFCRYINNGPGLGISVTIANQLFLLMDCRSFRLPSDSPERFSHWGEAQENWAFNLIRGHSGPVWLMNGSQFFPVLPFKESFNGYYQNNFDALLKEIKALPNRVIFVSGDVHYSELSEIETEAVGYKTYEITSSSVHSRCIPGAPYIFPNSRRLLATGDRNYNLITAKANGYGVVAEGVCRSPNMDNYSYRIEL